MGRPREVDDTAIFQATFRALVRLGYRRLSLAAVAEAAGVSPALLVKRYGSKRDLLLAFFERSNALSGEQFGLVHEQHASPLDTLLARFLLRLEFVADPIGLANLMSFYTETIADPDFARLGAQRLRMQHARIEGLLAEAVACGELAPCDVARVSRVLLAAVNGALMLWDLDDGRSAADRIREAFDVVLGPLRVVPMSQVATVSTAGADDPAQSAERPTPGPKVEV